MGSHGPKSIYLRMGKYQVYSKQNLVITLFKWLAEMEMMLYVIFKIPQISSIEINETKQKLILFAPNS